MRPSGVMAEVSENIHTVVTVRWTTAVDSIGYVEFGPTHEMTFHTPIEATPAKDHTATLLGLTADTEIFYRVVSWDGAAAGASAIATIRTGDLPVGMPPLTRVGDGQDGFVVVPVLSGGNTAAVVIINASGEIVWYHSDDRKLQFYRARLALDGKSLLYNAANISGTPSEASELVRVSLDGATSSSIPVPLLAHDFVEHPDGTLAAIVFEERDFQGAPLRGRQDRRDRPGRDAADGLERLGLLRPRRRHGR